MVFNLGCFLQVLSFLWVKTYVDSLLLKLWIRWWGKQIKKDWQNSLESFSGKRTQMTAMLLHWKERHWLGIRMWEFNQFQRRATLNLQRNKRPTRNRSRWGCASTVGMSVAVFKVPVYFVRTIMWWFCAFYDVMQHLVACGMALFSEYFVFSCFLLIVKQQLVYIGRWM